MLEMNNNNRMEALEKKSRFKVKNVRNFVITITLLKQKYNRLLLKMFNIQKINKWTHYRIQILQIQNQWKQKIKMRKIPLVIMKVLQVMHQETRMVQKKVDLL
jgi:hypothetical protein